MDKNNNTGTDRKAYFSEEEKALFPLTGKNLRLMAVAFGLIVIGFLLMLGGSSTMESFNADIYSFRRIILGPGIAFAGFIFMAYAIIKK